MTRKLRLWREVLLATPIDQWLSSQDIAHNMRADNTKSVWHALRYLHAHGLVRRRPGNHWQRCAPFNVAMQATYVKDAKAPW